MLQTPLSPEWWQIIFHLWTHAAFHEYLLIISCSIMVCMRRSEIILFPSDVEVGEVGYTPVKT